MAKIKKDTVTVVLPKPENMIGDTDTTVSVNGKMYQIMYDKPVEVPIEVAEVIFNSMEMNDKINEAINSAIAKPGRPALAEL